MKPAETDPPQIIAIAAMASNRVIGSDGNLPWHLPEDLQFFKKTTLGHPVLMGRKTFESIVGRIGKPLPGRQNIVLSKTMPPREDAVVIRDLSEIPTAVFALPRPVYLIGGAQLYEAMLPQCDELLITHINTPHGGDAFFPPFEDSFECKDTVASGPGWEIKRYARKA